MYVSPNFKTKKALRDTLIRGTVEVLIFQPNAIPHTLGTEQGAFSVEGPWYPQHYTWSARVEVVDGRVTRILQ